MGLPSMAPTRTPRVAGGEGHWGSITWKMRSLTMMIRYARVAPRRGGGTVDAQDSKSCGRKLMRVRFSPAAPKNPDSCRDFLCHDRANAIKVLATRIERWSHMSLANDMARRCPDRTLATGEGSSRGRFSPRHQQKSPEYFGRFLLGSRYSQVFTNFPCKELLDFTMPWHSRSTSSERIEKRL